MKEEEIIVGSPEYQTYREKYGKIERLEPEDKPDRVVFGVPIYWKLLILAGIGSGLLNGYFLTREHVIREKEHEIQLIDNRLQDNQIRDINTRFRVLFKGGEVK